MFYAKQVKAINGAAPTGVAPRYIQRRKDMKRTHAAILIVLTLLLCLLASCISREAAEQQGQTAQVSGSAAAHVVTFYQDGMVIQQVSVPHGGRVSQYPQGFEWRDASGDNVDVANLAVTEDMDLFVREQLDVRAQHVKYLSCEEELFQPQGYVTRGQLAQIVDILLGDEDRAETELTTFADVPAGDPVYESVGRVGTLGIMSGNGDGAFRPNDNVTRAEMVTTLCRLMDVKEMMALAFPDVPADHWAVGSVAAAMAAGWLNGYEDGNFYPDAPVTRAEAAVLINRARGRQVNKNAIDVVCKVSPYRDVSPKNWAYYDVIDASYMNELLSYILGEVEGLRPGFILLGDEMCHVNADLRLDYMQKGFHTFEDDLTTDGLYYAPEDGYFLQRSKPGLQELDGSMFYVEKADGPFSTNYDLGYLHFGENGRYTSGDETVDGYVDNIMSNIIKGDTKNLLSEKKLREAYDAIINGGYDYLTRNTGWQRGSTGWALQCARVMFTTKRGGCYYWAASFLYLARRLGFQAYPVCGGVNENNALHAWVMIEESGNEYIYDVELDWAYRTGAHGRVSIRPGRNLFKQLRGSSVVTYIFPGDTWYAPPTDEVDALSSEVDSSLYQDEFGNDLIEGVDYVVLYTDNGDGTITVTYSYLTGSRAGTSVSQTITGSMPSASPTPTADPNGPGGEGDGPGEWNEPPDGGWEDPMNPNGGTTVDPNNPNGGTTVDPNNPNGGTAVDPNNPNGGTVTEPSDPNGGTVTEPSDPNGGTVTEPSDPSGGEDPGAPTQPEVPVDPGVAGSSPDNPIVIE